VLNSGYANIDCYKHLQMSRWCSRVYIFICKISGLLSHLVSIVVIASPEEGFKLEKRNGWKICKNGIKLLTIFCVSYFFDFFVDFSLQ
jgi:hypothetical protein